MRTLIRVPSLQEVVNIVYDAALEPELWPDAAERMGAYCSSIGGVFWLDMEQGKARVASKSTPSDAVVTYGARYSVSDPANLFSLTVPLDTPSMTEDWGPRCRYRNSELYREFLRPLDIEDRAGIVTVRDARNLVLLGLGRRRKQDLFDRRTIARLNDLSPHFRRAFQLSHRLRVREEGVGALNAVMDRLEHGVFVVDEGYRVTYFNASAQQLLAMSGVLEIRRGELRAMAPAEAAALHALLYGALQTALGLGTGGGGTLVLHDPDGRIRLLLAVTPLRASPGAAILGASPVRALVIAREPQIATALSPEALRAWFGLTPAEASLAIALADGARLGDIADEKGLSRTTLKTHLAAIFDKTGVRRQSDLMKLLTTVSGCLMSAASDSRR